MSMEQNEPQVSQAHQGPPTGSASPATEGAPAGIQAGQQQRRRRRRRKTGRAAGPADAQVQTASQSPPTQLQPEPILQLAPEPGTKPYTGRLRRDRNRNQDRHQERNQDHEPGQAASDEVVAPEASRDQSGRQGRNQQHHHGKKQQSRQAKGSGGGSSQGRQFQKGGPPQQPARESNPGNGSPPAGGAYRKNKVRRAAPSFVGPMDHSYRVANGNIADGSPSTMDFRSNGSNGNGNVHGRNGYLDATEIAVPALLRDDAPVRIICFIEDLFVVAKMQETARKLGVKVSFAKAEKDTVAKLMDTPEAERPSLIVFDLNNVNAKPLTLIPKLKAKLKRSTSVIGFLSHIQGDLKVKAIEAGCDMVMPKSAFSQNLPNLLRRHGLDEELDAVEV